MRRGRTIITLTVRGSVGRNKKLMAWLKKFSAMLLKDMKPIISCDIEEAVAILKIYRTGATFIPKVKP